MIAATMFPTPLVVSLNAKYSAAYRIYRAVFITRKTRVYTIHGVSSAGLPCKEKKPIEILKFLYSRASFRYYCTICSIDLF